MKKSGTLLNLRSEPKISSNNILGQLLYGENILEETPSGIPNWSKVKTKLSTGEEIEGFVSSKFLRDSIKESKETLMYNAVKEWVRFSYGNGKEYIDPYYNYVGEMWKLIGMNLDGKDRDVPWSAAYISYVVRNSGSTYSKFRFAAAHARYIHDSIIKRNAQADAPFWGYRLHEQKPELGDIVCAWRINNIDYDFAERHDAFKSHCDIIIEVKDTSVKVIGGNVANSVTIKSFPLDGNGYLKNTHNVFALMKNRT